MSNSTRTEHDGMGAIAVPAAALWGPQTQRAVNNFPISGLTMPKEFIRALGLIKAAAARANHELGALDETRAEAIVRVAEEVASGALDAEFPVDVFQTGSGTSTNMNINEVISTFLRNEVNGPEVHPNDHVNLSQSSNDVIPTAIQVSAALGLEEDLLPALAHLQKTLEKKSSELAHTVKTGRTHLMDALPITFGQEVGAWAAQIHSGIERLAAVEDRLRALPLGGTAVGTGVNAPRGYAQEAIAQLSRATQIEFSVAENPFEKISAQDVSVELHGQLKTLACSLMKICNDLRWMNSGPLAGLGEISLPGLQPGSSIMPGKINPVIPEAVCMVCAQVMGNDVTVTAAGQSGHFQLNVMLPLIAHNLLQSIRLLANSSSLLADRVIRDFEVNTDRVSEALARNPILVTALNARIGYDLGAAIAKRAYAERRPVLEVALEMTDLDEDTLRLLLDPVALTGVQVDDSEN